MQDLQMTTLQLHGGSTSTNATEFRKIIVALQYVNFTKHISLYTKNSHSSYM